MEFFGKLGALILALLLFPELARAEDARCAEVRAGVAKYGQAVAIRWARANGYSNSQIRAARRCLIRRGSLGTIEVSTSHGRPPQPGASG
jgi:hypothetical protein